MPEKIKVGVIGVGALGRHHARLYLENPDVELVGIFDVTTETAEKVGAEFNIPVYKNCDELIEKCEAFSVAVPATYHHQSTIPLLKKGKHVLVEKPIAASVDEAEDMVKCAKENNVVFGVGHVERFNPAMDFIKKYNAETRFIEAHRLSLYPPARPGMHRRGTEVSVVLDLMIHDIDLILSMVNSEVEKIDAVGIPVLSDTEDIVNVRLKFKNGACANLTASRVSQEPQRRFRVFQEDTYVSMDYMTRKAMVLKRNKIGLARKDVELDEKNALAAELADFIDAVKATKASGKVVAPKVPGEQGLRALQIAIAIEKEIRSYNEKYGFKMPACPIDEISE